MIVIIENILLFNSKTFNGAYYGTNNGSKMPFLLLIVSITRQKSLLFSMFCVYKIDNRSDHDL